MSRGTIIAIGGREDKEGDKTILAEVARRIKGGKLVVTAIASEEPEGLLKDYRKIFESIGVKDVTLLEVNDRSEAQDPKKFEFLDKAAGMFFTGGDQLRITSQIADTPIFERILDIYKRGGVIAGTSAGASVVCATMLTAGNGSRSPKAGGVNMAPGLGLVENAVIDQHFAERGRMGRLLCAIAENPRMLGIGIDENTAVIFEGKTKFSVIGQGAVYVIDASTLNYTNIAEEQPNETLSLFNVTLHVLSAGDVYDLVGRMPVEPSKKQKLLKAESAGSEETEESQSSRGKSKPKRAKSKHPRKGSNKISDRATQ